MDADDIKAKETRTILSDYGKCFLCNEDYKAPKLLPCQHTFCSLCLESHILDAEAPYYFCPICDMKVELSPGGVDSLPGNFVYSILANKASAPRSTEKCISCEIRGKAQIAFFQCLDCRDALCQKCQVFHILSPSSRDHRIALVKELEVDKFKLQFATNKPVLCQKHSNEDKHLPLMTYCKKCQTLHCEECILNENEALVSSDNWQRVYKDNLKVFTKEVDVLLKTLEEQKETVGVIKKVEERIYIKKATIENQIYAKATELQDFVEKMKNEKLFLVQEHFEKELERCKDLLEKEKNHLKRLESTVHFAQTFMEHSTEGEYLLHEENVKTRMADFMIAKEKFEMRTKDLNLKCKPTEDIRQALSEVIGHFESANKCTDITGNEKDTKFVVEGKIKVNVEAHGIATTESGDIVVVGKSKIEILDKNGVSKKVISCEKLSNAWAVTVKYDLIFVSDTGYDSKQLLVLDMNGNLRSIIRMPVSEQRWYLNRGVGVAVSDESMIYICTERNSTIYTCALGYPKLREFTSRQQQPGLALPHNLAMTPHGHLVVSMCKSRNIHIYNQNAVLQWQFKNEDPCFGLCFDLYGHIIIGSYGSNKIRVVGKKSILRGNIEIPGVSHSRGLAITKEGELLVCHETKEITKVSLW